VALSDRTGPALTDRARAEAHAWSFYQLVRLLAQQPPGWKTPGGSGPASAENVRFRPAASLGFPRSDVDVLETLPDDGSGVERWRMTVNFMGTYGPSSPIANHYTESMLWFSGEGADAARDYVDLFNHRMISFIYRAWEKYRYPLRYVGGGRDEFSHRLRCLFGLGTSGMEEGAGLTAASLMRTAGLFADRHRSAAGLEQCLRTHFPRAALTITACAPRHARIPEAQRARLGRKTAMLGSAVLGERMADLAGAFRIEIGPLSLAEFRRFLPGGDDLSQLVRLTRLYVRDPLDFSVLLRLRAPEVPALRLAAPESLPLGHLSWVRPRGDEEGRALVSVQRIDPLRKTRAATPPPPPTTAGPVTPARPAQPVPRTTPRVTPVRR